MMKWIVFFVFTFVYFATAVATLIAFLAQSRLIPTDFKPGETIPYLGLLIGAVLVETAGGYIALAKNLFGLRTPPHTPESEKEIRALAITAMKALNRLQAIAYRYSSEFQAVIEKWDSLIFRRMLGDIDITKINDRNRFILEATKEIESAIVDGEDILLRGDLKKIRGMNDKLGSYMPRLEEMLAGGNSLSRT